MDIKLLGSYNNGNYTVEIYNDGTKIRETDDDSFISSFPECIDLKITNYCDMGCPYCHENSTKDGKHGDILNTEFINTLQPYTELAIGGGNPLDHPDLIEFLHKLKEKNIIANITVNQNHFMKYESIILDMVNKELIKGLGISLTNANDIHFIARLKEYPNAVLHVINGIIGLKDLEKLYGYGFKILILGYKQIRRGIEYYSDQVETNKKVIFDNISDIINGFKVVSFDNLAIRQLELRRIFTDKDWNEFFMGDDGQFTMYIDLVEEKFALSSTTLERHDVKDNIIDMFNIVKSK